MEHIIGHLCAQTRISLSSGKAEDWDYYGQCGLAQCMLYYAFQDAAIPFKPFANHVFDDMWFGHVAGTIDHLGVLYLVDSTYVQFKKDRYEGIPPFEILSKTAEGKRVAKDLKVKGYTTLTAKTAQLYINSFTNTESGSPICKRISFAWLLNPPPHPNNLIYGTKENPILGTRENLIRHGMYLETCYTLNRNKITSPFLTI